MALDPDVVLAAYRQRYAQREQQWARERVAFTEELAQSDAVIHTQAQTITELQAALAAKEG